MSEKVNYFPSKQTVEKMKAMYTPGTRVRLDYMEDQQAPPVGTLGTVMSVDDIGSIHVRWDNGSTLAIAYGADVCSIVLGGQDLENAQELEAKRIELEQKADQLTGKILDGYAFYEIHEDKLTWSYLNSEGDDGRGSFESCCIYPWQIPCTRDKKAFWDEIYSVCLCEGVNYSDIESFLADATGWLSLQERFEKGEDNILSDGCEDAMERIQLWSVEKTLYPLNIKDRFWAYDNILSQKLHYIRKVEGTITNDSFSYEIKPTGAYKDEDVDEEIIRVMDLLISAGLFRSSSDMKEFIWNHNCLHINDGSGDTKYALELRTEDYCYVIRISLTESKDNVHIFCYPAFNIRLHQEEAMRGVHLVDECGQYVITVSDGEIYTLQRVVNGRVETKDIEFVYVDRYHVLIDGNPVHLYSLFDSWQQQGWTSMKVNHYNFPI